MSGVNRVIIVGNLGRAPEIRYTQGGTAVCNLSVAVTEKVKDGDGWKDATEWFRVVCFGKQAENAGQYLEKGRQVYIEGRLQTRKYKDKDGVEKQSTEVVAHTIQYLGTGSNGKRGPTQEPQVAEGGGPAPAGFVDDDLPFDVHERGMS